MRNLANVRREAARTSIVSWPRKPSRDIQDESRDGEEVLAGREVFLVEQRPPGIPTVAVGSGQGSPVREGFVGATEERLLSCLAFYSVRLVGELQLRDERICW